MRSRRTLRINAVEQMCQSHRTRAEFLSQARSGWAFKPSWQAMVGGTTVSGRSQVYENRGIAFTMMTSAVGPRGGMCERLKQAVLKTARRLDAQRLITDWNHRQLTSGFGQVEESAECSKTVVIGEVAEWLMAPVLKTGIPERVSGVRIPPSPPLSRHYLTCK